MFQTRSTKQIPKPKRKIRDDLSIFSMNPNGDASDPADRSSSHSFLSIRVFDSSSVEKKIKEIRWLHKHGRSSGVRYRCLGLVNQLFRRSWLGFRPRFRPHRTCRYYAFIMRLSFNEILLKALKRREKEMQHREAHLRKEEKSFNIFLESMNVYEPCRNSCCSCLDAFFSLLARPVDGVLGSGHTRRLKSGKIKVKSSLGWSF